ncbi:hypothetical protein Ancab_017595 [Ancistrocladus abbreviatus]
MAAAAVCGSKFYCSMSKTKVQPSLRKHEGRISTTANLERRTLLLSTPLLPIAATEANDSRTQLLQKYLKKSEENKAKNDKERLESYYKRNYKDYFEFVEGTLQGKKEQQLTETEKGILDWLRTNK